MHKQALLFLAFIFLSVVSIAQYHIITPQGAANTLINNKGGQRAQSFIPTLQPDTATANLQPYAVYPGATTQVGNTQWYRNKNGTAWLNPFAAVGACNSLLSGGYVTWSGSGLTMNVTNAEYLIGCMQYSSLAAAVTLAAADPALPRIDVIAVDTSGTVIVLTGTPATLPIKPQINPATQLELTQVLVPAGSTTPGGITQVIVYDENTEWTGTAAGATVNFNNTVNPFHLVKATDVGTFSAANIIWTSPGSALFNTSDYSYLKLYIYLKDELPSGSSIYIYFTSGDSAVSNLVPLTSSYGFAAGVDSVYQNVTIPITDISPAAFNFNKVYVTVLGSSHPGMYIDYVQLQGGFPTPGQPYITNIFREPGIDSIFFTRNGVNFAIKDSTAANVWIDQFDDSPDGQNVDGENVTFVLSHLPNQSDSLNVFLNGIRQKNQQDFTIVDSTITFVDTPAKKDIINAVYRYTAQQPSTTRYDLSETNNIVFYGNSIFAGSPYLRGFSALPDQVRILAPTVGYYVQNRSYGGLTTPQLRANIPDSLAPYLSSDYKENIVFVTEGTNQIAAGAGAIATYDSIVSLCLAIKALPEAPKVVIATILPNSPYNNNAIRTQVNDSIIANWQDFADSLVNTTTNTVIGETGDNTNEDYYQSDHLHPWPEGDSIYAKDIIYPVLMGITRVPEQNISGFSVPQNNEYWTTYGNFNPLGDSINIKAGNRRNYDYSIITNNEVRTTFDKTGRILINPTITATGDDPAISIRPTTSAASGSLSGVSVTTDQTTTAVNSSITGITLFSRISGTNIAAPFNGVVIDGSFSNALTNKWNLLRANYGTDSLMILEARVGAVSTGSYFPFTLYNTRLNGPSFFLNTDLSFSNYAQGINFNSTNRGNSSASYIAPLSDSIMHNVRGATSHIFSTAGITRFEVNLSGAIASTLSGGKGAGSTLTLSSTTNASPTTGSDVIFATGTTARMRLLQNGNFGIGTATPDLLSIANSRSVAISNTTGRNILAFQYNSTSIADQDALGQLSFIASTTQVSAIVGGQIGTAEDAGYLGFFTKAAAGSITQYARLDNLGHFGFGGQTSPTAWIHAAAGTATANTAPLKLTNGTLNTTAEAGAVEMSSGFYQTKSSGLRYALGGVIADFTTDVNNSGTGETDLYTYTTPASSLAATGEKFEASFTGTFNDITATGQLQVYFGGTVIGNTGTLTIGSTGAWVISVYVIRTGSTTARASVNVSTPTGSTALYTSETDLTGLTFTNTNIIKITGTAGGASGGSNDITAKLGTIKWFGAAAN